MLEWLFSWEVVSVIAGLFVTVAFGVLALNDFKIAKTFFFLAAAEAAGGIAMWGSRSKSPVWAVIPVVFVAMGITGVLLVLALRYVTGKKPEQPDSGAMPTPNLVFVFGTPLGDNDSSQWLMMLRHFGPESAYNCNIAFADEDRTSIEHQWLIDNGSPSFPPVGMFDASSRTIYVPEANPEGPLPKFTWSPVDPDRQHYTVSISCRDGVFVEKWEVTRVNGLLRSRMRIERGPEWVRKNPNLDPIVFKVEDPEFVEAPFLTKNPNLPKKIRNPGWQKSHRYEVPVGIIDPNGNVEIISGLQQPDGSTRTNFGSWNLLTQHYSDSTTPQ